MSDRIKAVILEQLADEGSIPNVPVHEAHLRSWDCCVDLDDVSLFSVRVVVVVEVVQTDDFVAPHQQGLGQMTADETCYTRYEDTHRRQATTP
jgi:hypothetical protein